MLAKALGYEMHYNHPCEIMDEIAALTPSFSGVSFAKLDELGSIQWPCNEEAPNGTPIDARRSLRARQGPLHADGLRADRGAHGRPLPAAPHHGPHPRALQCRRADAADGECALA